MHVAIRPWPALQRLQRQILHLVGACHALHELCAQSGILGATTSWCTQNVHVSEFPCTIITCSNAFRLRHVCVFVRWRAGLRERKKEILMVVPITRRGIHGEWQSQQPGPIDFHLPWYLSCDLHLTAPRYAIGITPCTILFQVSIAVCVPSPICFGVRSEWRISLGCNFAVLQLKFATFRRISIR